MFAIRNTILVYELDTGPALLAYIIASTSLASLLTLGHNKLDATTASLLALIKSHRCLVHTLALQSGTAAILTGETLHFLIALIAVTAALCLRLCPGDNAHLIAAQGVARLASLAVVGILGATSAAFVAFNAFMRCRGVVIGGTVDAACSIASY